ncbi:MAG: hypothetical protein QOI39_507 [Mycobacterium sp.]|nr:hypothetical protein [Mycobacterium sp.]
MAAIGLALVLVASPGTQGLLIVPLLVASVVGRSVTNKRFLASALADGATGRPVRTKREVLLAVLIVSTPLFVVGFFVGPAFLAIWYAVVTVAIVEIRLRNP